ncbi:ubiquitin carboxyl-terminal hydrolase 19 isoform X2 [Ambystoma mexicanum]|uniref:ubiquitin carboxyl-terminal hydrolase 19 isoform X2 n=1 Tax=Ambystoma mexicanum TaxID=8296 RepID=UPI0037E7D56D
MSNSVGAAGQRRASHGLEHSSNKKKLKDRANLESKGKKPANSDSKRDMQVDWKQSSDTVIVKLNTGTGTLNVKEVDAAFTDTDCSIRLPDGRQWSCQFREEIEGSCSKVQYKEKGNFLQLILQKKIPMYSWPDLKRKKDIAKQPTNETALKENGRERPTPPLVKCDEMSTLPSPSALSSQRTKHNKTIQRGHARKDASADSGDKIAVQQTVATHSKKQTGLEVGQSLDPKYTLQEEPSTRCLKATCSDESFRGHSGKDGGRLNDCTIQAEETFPPTSPCVPSVLELPLFQAKDIGEKEKVEEMKDKMPCLQKQPILSEVPIPLAYSRFGDIEQQETISSAPLGSEGPIQSNLDAPAGLVASPHEPSPVLQPVVRQESDVLFQGMTMPEATTTNMDTKEVKSDPSKEDIPLEEAIEDPIINLTLVKNDHYEKGTDEVVVHVYVKEICKPMSMVHFREQDFTLLFQTSDTNFLRHHPGCGSCTVFRWQVKLRNLIEPDLCTYRFTGSLIVISLKKRQSLRWGGLEAAAPQVGGAKVAMPAGPTQHDKTQSGANQHTLSSKDDVRKGEIEKSHVEDGGLDNVAARATTEHVSVKQEPHVTTAKPTCMVTPMTQRPLNCENAVEEEEKKVCVPGFTGLVNLGNTCFMNSVIQSLSNTRELRDFFHDCAFESEINHGNPLGTGGRLAIGFAVLLRALWKGTDHAFQPSKLKAIVASKASQFTGYAQHDAQEFMAFLLDGLHEDLNRIQNKPYTETVDSDGRPDKVVADEAWHRHKMRNDSFVVDLFQGQYKSKLVCPVCSKVSITFDPFLYLPVPLPQKQKVLTVFFFAKEPHKKPVKFLVSISKENSNASDVLESISHSVRVNPDNLRLAEVIKNRFHSLFLPTHSLDAVSPADLLFCFEVLSSDLAKERVVVLQVQQRPQVPSIPISKCASCQKQQLSEEDKLKRCTRCYRVGYCNQVCQKTHWPDHKASCRPENIGYPFLISVPESRLTYARLTQLLEGYARFSVSVFQPPFQPGRISPEQMSRPLTPEKIKKAVKSSSPVPPEVEDKEQRELQDPPLLQSTPDHHPESGDCGMVRCKSSTDRNPSPTTASGFSVCSTQRVQDLGCEKETSYEKAIKQEAAVPGYQQSTEMLNVHATQFHIHAIDSNNKELRLEDKGDSPLDLTEDCSLALVWKNNDRLKEFVLVESKELECVEDPGSASDAARAGHFTLEQCLNLFTKPEVLAPEEAWYCPTCKQHREASKQLMLWRLPNVLIIQLKRFSFRSFIWRDKINDMVDFPVRNLDLSKFCIGQKEDHQLPIYDLYAVINHYGGMIGGHYTAYARLPNDKNSQRSDVGWRLFDDSTVTTVEESQVVTRYAYVLFYRRRNSPVERPRRDHVSEHRADSTSVEAAASQATLIWQELEAEEEEALQQSPSHRRFLWNNGRPCNLVTDGIHGQNISEFSDEGRIRYFIIGTMAAIVALFFNVLYPLMYLPHGR